jgi:ribosomal protein S11
MRILPKLIALLFFGAIFQLQAADDTNVFPILQCKSETFTNARISSVTAAYAFIFYDGGGKKVPLGDLPEDLQKQYGYDPQRAEQALESEKAKKNAAAQAVAEQAAANAVSQGERQKVKILKVMDTYIGDTRCQIEAEGGEKEVLMSGGDLSLVRQYYEQLQQLQNEAASTAGSGSATTKTPHPHNRYAAQIAAQNAAAQQTRAANNRNIESELKALKAQGTNIISIYAAPTSRKYANLPIWVYLGKAK